MVIAVENGIYSFGCPSVIDECFFRGPEDVYRIRAEEREYGLRKASLSAESPGSS